MRERCLGRGRVALILVALALVGQAAGVQAAPPCKDEKQAPVSETRNSKSEQTVGKYLFLRGNILFEQNDYLGAVKAWEQMLAVLPCSDLSHLVNAHRMAYEENKRPEHLASAQQLLTMQKERLRSDEQGLKVNIDAELEKIKVELNRIRELKEAEARAEEQAKEQREKQIRDEQIRLGEIKLKIQDDEAKKALAAANAEYERDKRLTRRKIYYSVGGSLAGLGAGSLGAMSAFLVSGVRLDREGQKLAASTGVEDGAYEDLLAKGTVYNRVAVATGIVGGVFVGVGVSLLVVAAVRYKPGPSGRTRVAVYPTLGGVLLRF